MAMKIDFSKVHQVYAEIQIGELQHYLNTIEKLLKDELRDFKKRVESEAQKISDPHMKEEFFEFYSDDYWRLSESFVRIMRNSFLVTVFSLVENQLGVICDRLQEDHSMQINWRDLKYDTLERGNLYIKNSTGHAPNSITVWSDLRSYQKLRNCIVHNNGEIEEKKIIDYARRKGILQPGDKTLFLSEEFCHEVISRLRIFFEELYTLVSKSQKEHQKAQDDKGAKSGEEKEEIEESKRGEASLTKPIPLPLVKGKGIKGMGSPN